MLHHLPCSTSYLLLPTSYFLPPTSYLLLTRSSCLSLEKKGGPPVTIS
jgi:hypothetical protein